MFNEIISILKKRGAMSLKELSLALEMDASALSPMLEMLAAKGRVEKVAFSCGAKCPTCTCADPDSQVFYKVAG